MRNINGHPVALQAHRGVSTERPENTMAAFRAAVEQGYDVIELDPKFTLDDKCVVLHDRTLMRTARDAQGAPVNAAIAEITFEAARGYDFGSWFAPKYAGESIPLLEDVLIFASEHRAALKLDNVIESFTPAQTQILFDLVERTGMEQLAGFTCTKPEYICAVAERFPRSVIHYDGPVDESRLSCLRTLVKSNPLVVWLPYPNKLTDWCAAPAVSAERAELVRRIGARLGVWIIEDDADFTDACVRFAPDIVETTGSIKPDGIQ